MRAVFYNAKTNVQKQISTTSTLHAEVYFMRQDTSIENKTLNIQLISMLVTLINEMIVFVKKLIEKNEGLKNKVSLLRVYFYL